MMSTLSLIFRRLVPCIAGVALFWYGSVAQATIILADVRGDYVAGVNNGDPGILSATGTGTWNYLASDTTNPTLDGSLDVMEWQIDNTRYRWLSDPSSTDVGDAGFDLATDEIYMHPSHSIRPPSFAVVRWIAGPGEAGLINITGNVRKIDAGGGGGITFDLFVDGNSFLSSLLPFNDTVGVSFNQSLTVGVGSTVDFVVGPNGDDAWDSTGLRATITAEPIPEPATIALLGIGLAGLVGKAVRRRRKWKAKL